MKKLIITTTAIICLIAIQSCNNNAKSDVKKEEPPVKTVHSSRLLKTSVHVPLAEAQDNIRRYNDMCVKFFKTVPIKAYTIHADDLLEVLGVPLSDSSFCSYKHARAYLGMDSLNNFKLYFTPVEGADLGAVPQKSGHDVILADELGQYVLDLNAPCPKTCDYTSPLYYDKADVQSH
ncbi:MAG: hypothetical protein V4506_18115 [Bacteroidota bacterium]